MPSDYRLILDGTTYYLNNTTAKPVVGGDVRSPSATPLLLASDRDYLPRAPKADVISGGDTGELLGLSYEPIDDSIELLCRAASAEQLAQILATLTQHSSLTTAPGVLWCQPRGVTAPILFAVSRVEGEITALDGTTAPGEGSSDALITLRIRRSHVGGASSLRTLISAVSVTNGSITSLGTLPGDMAQEGMPLVIRLAKPTAQSPTRVYLGSVHSRTQATIASTLSAITSTSGSAFTASSSISAAPLRTTAGVHLRVLARLTTLTNPTSGRVRVRAESSTGAILWQGDWVDLGSNTTAQLLDLGSTPLSVLRVPTTGTPAIVLRAELSSSTGTAVTATLATLDALWCYDWSAIDLGTALASGQTLVGVGVVQIPNGPYLPAEPWQALVADTSDIPVQAATPRGTLPRAITGASLYVAWCDAGNAHTNTDTANLTVQLAPLWRSIRPLI